MSQNSPSTYDDMSNYPARRAACTTAIRLGVRRARAYLNLGPALYGLRDRVAARSAWRRALALYHAQGDRDGARTARNDLILVP